MKYKTTKKEVMQGYTNIICVGYCSLQQLLNYENPVAYTARREGWAADVYQADSNTAIITGYAPFGNIRPGYDVCKKYEHAAEKIRYDNSISYEEQRQQLQTLLHEFVKEVTQ